MKIIGITGTLGAGKGTAVEFLKKQGFQHYSARDFIVEEIKRRQLPVNRDSMTVVSNDLRKKHSPSYIIDQLYAGAKAVGENAVIESIRTVGEVNSLREKGNFLLLAIDADQKKRYERISGRGSTTDQVSFRKFQQDEAREMESTDPNKQNFSACIALADVLILNNGTVEEFEVKIKDKLMFLE